METLYRFDLLENGKIHKFAINKYERITEDRITKTETKPYYRYKDKWGIKYALEYQFDKLYNNRVYTFKNDIEYVKNIIDYALNDKILYYKAQEDKYQKLIELVRGSRNG